MLVCVCIPLIQFALFPSFPSSFSQIDDRVRLLILSSSVSTKCIMIYLISVQTHYTSSTMMNVNTQAASLFRIANNGRKKIHCLYSCKLRECNFCCCRSRCCRRHLLTVDISECRVFSRPFLKWHMTNYTGLIRLSVRQKL